MDEIRHIGLIERTVRGEIICLRPILLALWQYCLLRHKGSRPDRFGQARAYALANGIRHQRVLIVLHCMEAEYNACSTCDKANAGLQVLIERKRLTHSALRIYETKLLKQARKSGPSS